MRMRSLAKWLVVLALIVSGWVVALRYWIGYLNVRPALPDLAASERWILVKQYSGKLDSAKGEVVAKVYVYRRPYTEVHHAKYEVAQNRIDIHDQAGNRLTSFMWPGGKVAFAGGWCEILDINNDGAKEFLLFDDQGIVRVVSYEAGGLQYKEGFVLINRKNSAGFYAGAIDLDGDGKFEFIAEDFFSLGTKETVPIPRLKHWNPKSGFYDVSSQFPRYYERIVIPELRSRAANARADVREAHLLAIGYIESKILKRQPTLKAPALFPDK